jgi:hypothetical protein
MDAPGRYPSPERSTFAARALLFAVGMNALLTALVLAASPEAPRTETPAPHRAFWVQPIGTAVLGLALRDTPALYLPLGANLPVWENSSTSLGVELTVTTGSMRSTYEGNSSRPVPNYWRVIAAAGPVFSLTGRPLSGPFVQPKLLTNFSYEPEYGYDLTDQPGGASVEVHLGLDLGWQFTSGMRRWGRRLLAHAGALSRLPGPSGRPRPVSGQPSHGPRGEG